MVISNTGRGGEEVIKLLGNQLPLFFFFFLFLFVLCSLILFLCVYTQNKLDNNTGIGGNGVFFSLLFFPFFLRSGR